MGTLWSTHVFWSMEIFALPPSNLVVAWRCLPAYHNQKLLHDGAGAGAAGDVFEK